MLKKVNSIHYWIIVFGKKYSRSFFPKWHLYSKILRINTFRDYSFFDPLFQKWRLYSKILRINTFRHCSFFGPFFQRWRFYSKIHHVQISLNSRISFAIIYFSILLSKMAPSFENSTYQHVPPLFIFRSFFPKMAKIHHVQISLNSRISFVIIHFSILLSKMAPPFEILYIKMFCDYSFLDPLFQKWRLYSKILRINTFKYL